MGHPRQIRWLVGASLAAAATLAPAPRPAAPVEAPPSPISRDVHLMGTRATLTTFDAVRSRGLARLETLLEALEATDAELSTWRADSALSRLNTAPPGAPVRLPASLCRTLGDVRRWTSQTGGAFDPAVAPLVDAWQIRSGGAVPDAETLRRARRASGLHHLRLDERACVAVRTGDVSLDAGAFGKGEALDRAADAVGGVAPWIIDLGGQVIVHGAPPGGSGWTVDVAHPQRRDDVALTVTFERGSLATSGGSERDRLVGGTRIGHILDPRTGRPATYQGSVTVWHERALVADVLSTALFVMGVDAGLAWADDHGVAAVFLQTGDGRGLNVSASDAFAKHFPGSGAR